MARWVRQPQIMTNTARAAISSGLYGHLVAATVLQCLVIVAALASRTIGLWAAMLLLVSALTLAAHAAHLRRGAASAGDDR